MTSTTSRTQKLEKIEDLSLEVKKHEKELEKILEAEQERPKWNWSSKAMTVVNRLRQLANDNTSIVRQDLDNLLKWPDKTFADPKGFYGAKKGFEIFNRNEDWFEVMGFTRHETQYTFSNAWDKREVGVTFLIPDTIETGTKIPIMWYFHGGGFVSESELIIDHIPWYSKASLEHAKRHKAVVIAPDYPLGPEANYKDISDAIQDFLRFYKDDGCFEKDEQHWTQWLTKRINIAGITLDKDRVFIEGESAGGQAVITALFLNADKLNGTKLKIKSALLRYPMIEDYQRSWTIAGKSLTYMGKRFSKDDIDQQARLIAKEITFLENMDLCPTRSKGYAPQYMSSAFLLSASTSGLWKWAFTRQHGLRHNIAGGSKDPDYADSLGRAVLQKETTEHEYLPPIYMYHGHDDTNCPFQETDCFKKVLIALYPTRYVESKTIHLEKVTDVGHGFDYDLDADREEFVRKAYCWIDNFW
ncbi:Alpha/Beta hydrolase protein [Pyrenochaeta sp. MPI-SDFR-AT-0127]|nr:Alpha/Beta hydrolase protein [Pyrenochaeta sp. MPI-SDFR-AT-0127]